MCTSKIIAKELAGNKVKIIHGAVKRNVDPLIEWIKWLSYIPDFQKSRIKYLESKVASDISLEELNELNQYRIQAKIAKLFKLYGTSDISKNEYIEVYNYMKEHSIEDLMLSKLSKEELSYAKKRIQYFSQISKEELELKIKREQKEDNYSKLSMVDSYILHEILRINYSRNETNTLLGYQLGKNAIMRQKSIYYASNPYKL